jgi:NitT/TauT family transport system permease protein
MTRRWNPARLMPPLLFGVAFLAIWEGAVKLFGWKPYFLAPPTKVWEQFTKNFSIIRKAAFVTGSNGLIGLLVGMVLGAAMSFVVRRFRLLNELITPLAVALNAVPIFVLVAVFNNMFAITSQVPRRLMVTLVVYFIVLVNVTKGLSQVSATHLELMRSYAASESAIMRKLRIPNAIPYLFTALRIAAPAAVITAIVSEYFGGSQDGLGYKITSSMSSSKNAIGLACVLAACIVALAFYLISSVLESVATPGGGAPQARLAGSSGH